MPGKQVSQETFDAIVREAISDFSLSPPAALREAKAQLRAVGVVDFSNIVTSLASSGAHPVLPLVSALGRAVEAGGDAGALRAALQAVEGAARGDAEACGVAGEKGAVEMAVRAMEAGVAGGAARVLGVLCGNEVNRGRFLGVSGGMRAVVGAVCAVAGEGKEGDVCDVLGAVRVLVEKSEGAKARFVAGGEALEAVLGVLERAKAARVVGACCGVLRALLAADDVTQIAGETFNRAKVVCGVGSVMESGLVPLSEGVTPLPEILAVVMRRLIDEVNECPDGEESAALSLSSRALLDCFVVARMCAVSDEICERLVELGYLQLTRECLECGAPPLPLARGCFGLLRGLAARDQAKAALCGDLGLAARVAEAHKGDAALLERFCGLVAAVCLRRADLAARAEGAVGAAVLGAMERFGGREGVQKAACGAVRNLVVRNGGVGERWRREGVAERLLRRALREFPGSCGDVAYNGLHALDVLEDAEMRRDRRYTTPF